MVQVVAPMHAMTSQKRNFEQERSGIRIEQDETNEKSIKDGLFNIVNYIIPQTVVNLICGPNINILSTIILTYICT